MKYIAYTDNGMPALLIFPAHLCHADVAMGRQVTSAGFVDFDRRRCFGESISLGIKANEQHDTLLLRVMFNEPAHHGADVPALLRKQAS